MAPFLRLLGDLIEVERQVGERVRFHFSLAALKGPLNGGVQQTLQSILRARHAPTQQAAPRLQQVG